MITGDSGSGKSSLARAGLVPRWRGGALAEAMGERPSDTVWHVVQTQPRTRPFQALAEAVGEAAKRLGLSLADRGTLESWARSGDPDQVRRALWCDLPPDHTRVLLLVDQFEELVTIAETAEREPFVRLLLALADPNDSRGRVVLTMRRDYYNLISTFPELYDRLEADGHRARQILGRISPNGLRCVVTEPLRLADVPEGDRTALADQVAAEMGDRPGDLALVQMALTETWDRRRGFGDDLLRAYTGVGRIEGAIARAAEDVYQHVLDEDERTLAEPVFIRLVRLGDTGGATRRLATRIEFDDAKWQLVQKLASKEAKRLVLVGGGETGETAEIAHEALVTQWPRYQTWLSGLDPEGGDRAADKRALDVLTPRAMDWAAAPDAHAKAKRLATGADLDAFVGLAGRRPAWLSTVEHKLVSDSHQAATRQQRRERWRFRAAIGFILVLLLLVVFAGWQWVEAKAQTHLANAAIRTTSASFSTALSLSEYSGVPRSEIGKLLTRAITDFEQLMQEGTGSVWKLLTRAITDFEQFMQEGTGSELRYEYAWRLMTLADHYRIIGEAESRWDAATKAHDLLKELVAEYPSNNEFLKQLAISYDQIGDIHAHRTKREQALREYHASRDIREKLSKDDPSNPHLKRGLSISYSKIGDILFEQGNDEDALKAFEEALKKATQSLPDDPLDIESQRNLLVINHRIGDVLLAKNFDLQRARDVYDKSLSIAKELAAHYHDNNQLQRDLSASHEKIGDLLEVQENLDGAFQAYHDSLLITQRLYDDDPEKVDIQDDLALGHENIGGILLKQGNPQAALYHYQQSLAIRKQLADEDPSEDVLWSHDHIGYTFRQLDQVQAATGEYQASYVIAERLAAADPENATWQYLSYRQLGQVRELEGNAEEALKIYCRAKNVIQSALPSGKPRWQKQLDWLKERLAAVQGSGTSKC
jgi:tetratricopeptide (TPR) repeat protein